MEPSDVHGSHHDGWIAEEEEEQEDRDDDILPDFDDLVQNLLTSEERAGRVPKFERVLDELKQSVSSRSTFSRFSFLVRLLYIKHCLPKWSFSPFKHHVNATQWYAVSV